ncbi:MAG: low affinity iron permease family protein [Thermomicrobiales bacterium]|nr:low affinity iron permease family protein [Thermomicrobiales bacterium]
MASWFSHFSARMATIAGRWETFIAAFLLVVLWAASGPFFGFSDAWQLVINTGTTISTGLMVFLIQNSQNRDSAAIHLKLDELIRATEAADDAIIEAEEETDAELASLKQMYLSLIEAHHKERS